MTITDNEREVFLVIDANAIVHRAFHAYPPTLETEDGIQVNAVYGFTSMLLNALEIFSPKYVLCAMDVGKPTFRHVIYSEYKGTRGPADLSLIDQFPLVEEILKSFNIPVLKKEGYEADDILGTVSRYVSEGIWKNENLDMYILSGDRDLLQLIDDRVFVCLPNGNFKNIVVYDREKMYEKFGYYPEQVVDYKGMVGDPSDNIPGIKGIGEKTALELLRKYQSLDGIYKHIDEIDGRLKTLLVEGFEQAEFSRQLAKIDRNVKVDIHLTDCILKDFDRKFLTYTFKKFAFKSLLKKLDSIFGKEDKNTNYSQLDMFREGNEEYRWNDENDFTKNLNDFKQILVAYINTNESFNSEPYILVRGVNSSGQKSEYILKPFYILKNLSEKNVIFYNFEELSAHTGGEINIDYTNFFDICLAQHLLNSEKRNTKLKDIAFSYSSKMLDEKIYPNQIEIVMDIIEDAYAAQKETMNNLELYDYTRERIQEYLNAKEDLLEKSLVYVEIPTSLILSQMEKRGIGLDWEKLSKLRDELRDEIENVSKEIYSIVGHEFNINSPKQLSDILYKELSLPSKGKDSTKESLLRELTGMHPIIEHVIYFREISKILSTYVEPLYLNSGIDGDGQHCVYTDFKQTGTTSGRFSSINPNMQNLPLDGKWAKRLRECFKARNGYQFVAMDYSQMELRIMADIAQDKLLIQDFVNGSDIHSTTAARVLGKKNVEVTPKDRKLGKIVNFGMIFGQTPFGLSTLLGVDRETAGKYIRAYFDHYKGVEEYMRKIEFEAFEKGYVQTMFGTTRHISGIRSKNVRARAAAAREAINMPIQGSEADIMKYTMIKIQEYIEGEFKNHAYIISQIHDEIIMEVEKESVEKFIKDVQKIMLSSIQLSVPFEVHVYTGSRFSDLK